MEKLIKELKVKIWDLKEENKKLKERIESLENQLKYLKEVK